MCRIKLEVLNLLFNYSFLILTSNQQLDIRRHKAHLFLYQWKALFRLEAWIAKLKMDNRTNRLEHSVFYLHL